jgi:anthranilate synthase component 1
MTAPTPVTVLRKRLALDPDPYALFRAWRTAHPEARGLALFESADTSGGRPTKSLLYTGAALRAEARGRTLAFTALGRGGRAVLAHLAARLGALPGRREGDVLTVEAPAPPVAEDEERRLRAPGLFDPLRALLADWEPASERGAIHLHGLFAYDLVDAFETLPARAAEGPDTPDLVLHLAEGFVLLDHTHGTASVHALLFGGADEEESLEARRRVQELATLLERTPPRPDSPPPPPPTGGRTRGEETRPLLDDESFAALVARLKEHVRAGDVFQIVPSRAFVRSCPDPLAAYRALRARNPSPYMFFVDLPEGVLFGASPESALTVEGRTGRVAITPIAGTRPRGRRPDGSLDPERDTRLELELRLSAKELAEHNMLVDLARNDVARVSAPGTRRVTDLHRVERYAHVMHLVSRVEGRLAEGLDALHAAQASFNMGTLTGAPKLKAMELLRRYEPTRRGPYGGAVGYLTAAGDMDTAIVIRSAYVADGRATVQAGAGVVADSDPKLEADETRHKARAVLEALNASSGDAP